MNITKRVRFYFRLWPALLQKQRRLILLGMLLGVTVFFLMPRIFGLLNFRRQETIGLVGRYTAGNLPPTILEKLSHGLTRLDEAGIPQPDLAEKWEVKDDGKTYVFHLKSGLFWHDGEPMAAEDIIYPFSDVATKVVDDQTVIFELLEPYSPFPVIVSQPVFKSGLIGNGEFELRSLKEKYGRVERVELRSTDRASPGMTYRFYPNQEAAKTAFKLGEVDSVVDLSSPGELKDWPNVTVKETQEKNRYAAVFFNNNHPQLGDKNLRQALAYAIDKDWPFRSLGPIRPQSWAYNPGVKPYHTDLNNAKNLLDKSQEGRDGNDVLKTIELSTLPSLLTDAEKIKTDWEKLGLEVKIKVINSLEEEFEALLLFQESPPDPDQYPLWHSTQPTNLTRYSNPKIDVLLEEGRKTTDLEKRKEIYLDFQRFVVEESPAVFLFHPTLYTIKRE